MKKNKQLAIFDLDHCLVDIDLSSKLFKELIKHRKIDTELQFLPFQSKLIHHLSPGHPLPELFLVGYRCLKGVSVEDFNRLCDAIKKPLLSRIRKEIKQLVSFHQDRGDQLLILSCSAEPLVKMIAEEVGVEAYAGLRLYETAGKFTGVASHITGGKAKLLYAIRHCDKIGIDPKDTYFYTDAIDDLALLSVVGHPRVTYPDDLLKQEAEAQKWPIIDSPESAVSFEKEVVLILTASTGGGHTATAKAIKYALSDLLSDGKGYRIVIQNTDDVSIMSAAWSKLYNYLSQNHPALYVFWHDFLNETEEGQDLVPQVFAPRVEKIMRMHDPALIISVHSMVSALAGEFKRLAPKVPFITAVSDWFGHCLKEWGNTAADLVYCPSQINADYLIKKMGTENIEVGYPIYHPKFLAENINVPKETLYDSMQLKENLLTLLVASASENDMAFIKAIATSALPYQVLVLCHNNRSSFEEVQRIAISSSIKIVPIMWAEDIQYLLHISDFVLTKPGPGLCQQALSLKTGILVNESRSILPQEKEVAEHVKQLGFAFAVKQPKEMMVVLRRMAQGKQLAEFKAKFDHYQQQNGIDDFCQIVLDRLYGLSIK